MPMTWAQVQADPRYQKLSPDQQERARAQYFTEVVAPRIPPDQLEVARQQFDADTKVKKAVTPREKAQLELPKGDRDPNWVGEFFGGVKRGLGLGARMAVEGAAAIPATVVDVASFPYNVAALATGAPQVPEQNLAVSNALTTLGLPKPEGFVENAENILGGGVVGGGLQSGIARAGAKVATNPTVQDALMALAGHRTPSQAETTMRPAAEQARATGLSLPTSTTRDTNTRRILDKLLDAKRTMNARNQEVVNEVAKHEIGLKGHIPLNDEVLDAQKKIHGPAYQAVKDSIPYIEVDEKYLPPKLKGLPNVIEAEPTLSRQVGGSSIVPGKRNIPNPGRFRKMFKTTKFPPATPVPGAPYPKGLAPSVAGGRAFTEEPGKYMDTNEAMEAIKELRKAATKDFRASEREGGSKLYQRAKAQQQAADQLENLIERNLEANGDKALYDNFVKARRELAKIHTVQNALNRKTGNISASKLAKNYKRLSGKLKQVARAQMNFPDVMQGPKGSGLSKSDIALELLSAAAGQAFGHGAEGVLGGAAAIAGRHTLSDLLVRDPVQDALMRSMGRTRNALLPQAGLESALLAARLSGHKDEGE